MFLLEVWLKVVETYIQPLETKQRLVSSHWLLLWLFVNSLNDFTDGEICTQAGRKALLGAARLFFADVRREALTAAASPARQSFLNHLFAHCRFGIDPAHPDRPVCSSAFHSALIWLSLMFWFGGFSLRSHFVHFRVSRVCAETDSLLVSDLFHQRC